MKITRRHRVRWWLSGRLDWLLLAAFNALLAALVWLMVEGYK
uniref:Uncharacterized protein n=1 Tax=viral metagenome TaxID=1070528 RepID=A0A6M3K3L1_9ZZZZ